MTINLADLLAAGTPSGVGYSRTPPWLLHPGDVVEGEVERIDVRRTPIVDNLLRHETTARPEAAVGFAR